jgi:uncharacterized protein involved in outer membrane biogenesis
VKRVLVSLLGLLFLAIAAVIVAPSFIDWNAYRGELVAEIEQATGREVRIAGDISLRIVPSTTFSVEGVAISNIEGGSEPEMLTLGGLLVEVAPLALLERRLEIRRIEVRKAEILLERLPDGRVNWAFSGASKGNGSAAEPGRGQGLLSQVTLQKVLIAESALVYRDGAAGVEERLEKIAVELSAESLTGPFRINGSLDARGLPLAVDLRAGRIDGTETPLALELALPREGAELKFLGKVIELTGKPSLEGNLQMTAGRLDRLIAGVSGQSGNAPLLGQPFTLAGTLSANDSAVSLSDAELALGEIKGAGQLSTNLGTSPLDIDLNLQVARVDLDGLLALSDTATATPGDSLDPGEADFSLPSEMNLSFDLSSEVLIYRGQVVRQLRLGGTLADGLMTLERFQAQVPGGSDFSANGTLRAVEGKPQFSVDLEFASDNLRSVLSWMGVSIGEVPADRLRRSLLTLRLQGVPDSFSATDIDLQVDVSRVTGGIAVVTGPRLGLGAGLTLDKLDLDAYFPADGSAHDSSGSSSSEERPSPFALLEAVDANFDLRAQQITYRGKTAEQLHLDGTLAAGKVTLRRAFVGKIANARLEASGTFSDLSTNPNGRLDLELTAQEPAALASLFAVQHPLLDRLADSHLVGSVASKEGRFDLEGTLETLGGRFSLRGVVSPLKQPATFDLTLTGKHPAGERLLARLQPGGPALGALGALGFEASAKGDGSRFDLDSRVSLGEAEALLKGPLTLPVSGSPEVDLQITLNAPKPLSLLAALGVSAPNGSNPGALTIAGRLKGSGDHLENMLEGTLGQGRYSLRGVLQPGNDPIAFEQSVELHHPDAGALVQSFGSGADSSAGIAQPLDLASTLRGTSREGRADKLSVKLGANEVKGSLVYMMDDRPALEAELYAGELDLAVLSALSGSGSDADRATTGKVDNSKKGGQERWSDEAIDLTALQAYDGRLTLTADHLVLAPYRLSDARVSAALKAGRLTLERLTGRSFGGRVSLTGVIDANGTPAISGDYDLTDIDSEAALRVLADFDRISGPVSLTGTMGTKGVSQRAMISNLAGRGRIDGRVTLKAKTQEQAANLLVGILGQQVGQVRGLADATNSVFSAFAGREARLSGTHVTEQGVVTSDDLLLESDRATARARMTADLPRWLLDLESKLFRQQDGDVPFLTVTAKGPLDSPSLKVGGQALSGAQAPQQQIQQGIEGQLQKLVPGLIPGTQVAPTSAPTAAPSPAPAQAPIIQQAPLQQTAPTAAPTVRKIEPVTGAASKTVVPTQQPQQESTPLATPTPKPAPTTTEQVAPAPAPAPAPSRPPVPGEEHQPETNDLVKGILKSLKKK